MAGTAVGVVVVGALAAVVAVVVVAVVVVVVVVVVEVIVDVVVVVIVDVVVVVVVVVVLVWVVLVAVVVFLAVVVVVVFRTVVVVVVAHAGCRRVCVRPVRGPVQPHAGVAQLASCVCASNPPHSELAVLFHFDQVSTKAALQHGWGSVWVCGWRRPVQTHPVFALHDSSSVRVRFPPHAFGLAASDQGPNL